MASTSEPETPRQRLFFALWPPEAVVQRLHDLQRKALDGIDGRRTAADRLHLTLRFIGSVDTQTADCLTSAAAAIRIPPFTLEIDHLGVFPRARVVWAGVSHPPPELLDLAGTLERICRDCDLPPESRPFAPHLTLLRKAPRHVRLSRTAIDPVVWPVREFVLVASDTRPEGAVYTVVERWPLQAPDG